VVFSDYQWLALVESEALAYEALDQESPRIQMNFRKISSRLIRVAGGLVQEYSPKYALYDGTRMRRRELTFAKNNLLYGVTFAAIIETFAQ